MFAGNMRLITVLLLFAVLFLTASGLWVYDKWSSNRAASDPWVNVNREMESLLQTLPADKPKGEPDSNHTQKAQNDNSSNIKSEQAELRTKDEVLQRDIRSADSSLIDINTASVAELDDLPGIGPSKAKAIAEYREQHGRFTTLEQLMDVKGIGPKMFEKMKGKVKISK